MQKRPTAHTEPKRCKMRIQVSRQQESLKEKQTGVPNRRDASDIRQDHFGGQRLNPKEQRGVDEYGDGIKETQRQSTLMKFPEDHGSYFIISRGKASFRKSRGVAISTRNYKRRSMEVRLAVKFLLREERLFAGVCP
jgi:hypothetical protein